MAEETKNMAIPCDTDHNADAGKKHPLLRALGVLVRTVTTLAALLGALLVVGMLTQNMLLAVGSGRSATAGTASDVTIMDRYDMFMTNQISTALEGVLNIEKVYWLSDNDEVAPKPAAENYGTADSPAELMWLLEEAAELIDGRELTFNENIVIWEHSKLNYYYDETILVITWQQVMDNIVHTVSEIIVADASQFRRGLAGGEFGSDKQFVPSQIAQNVNAVVATSGDFYKFRKNGIIVHKGQLRRFEGKSVDTCFIDDKGNLLFVRQGELSTEAEAQKYIEEHNVRFSLAFGPILVEDGKNVVPSYYPIGEINGTYTRSAVCQKGELHYLFVNTSGYKQYNLTARQRLRQFGDHLIELGVNRAYTLDGGQTTVIAMDGKLISAPDFGAERQISDIIYFATALPDGE